MGGKKEKKKTQEEAADAEVDAEEATGKKSKKKAKQEAEADDEEPAAKKEKKQQKQKSVDEADVEESAVARKPKKPKAADTSAVAETSGTADASEPGQRTAKEGRIARKKAQQMRRKLKAKGIEPDSQEAKRRLAQKEMKTLVLKLRADEASDKDIGKAKMDAKKETGSFCKPDGRREKKKAAWLEWVNSAEVQDKSKKEREENKLVKHDLVIIPVTWRGRHDNLDIQKAAEDIKVCVAQQGVDAWIDSRRQFTPGQKFHWEFRGVMLRIEIGPEDVEKGLCRICKAETAGDYQSVKKKSVRLPPGGGRKMLLTLKEWGLDKIGVDRREGEEDDDSEDEPVVYAPKGNMKGS